MKYFLSFFSCFFFLNASSQKPEEIGKAIFESFKKNDDTCFKYYLSESIFKVKFSKVITGFEESVQSGETTWNKIAKYYEITRTITNKISFIKALKEKVEVEERNK